MKLDECIKKINQEELLLSFVNECECSFDISSIYIGDLLSHVMANGKDEALWLTVQRHVNVIAVAELNDFIGIVFVEGVCPEEETIKKANELNIPLFKTSLDAFALIKKFVSLGI